MIPFLITKDCEATIRWKRYFGEDEYIVSWEQKYMGRFFKPLGTFSRLEAAEKLIRRLGFGGYKINTYPGGSYFQHVNFNRNTDWETGVKEWEWIYKEKA